MTHRPTHDRASSLVVKLGGSLLLRPDLSGSLRDWLFAQTDHPQINVIVGGGAMIDALRTLDRIHQLDPVAMHWRCVRALRLTLEVVAAWIPEAVVIDTRAAFARHARWHRSGWFLIAPEAFYFPGGGDPLPCDWTTSSDSIAALLARRLGAGRLVLLKSCELPERLDLSAAAAAGIVDPVFPQLVDPSLTVELMPLAPSPARAAVDAARLAPLR
jgi:5-(aminomethyl)-3-furanmethanol phosphate kinase